MDTHFARSAFEVVKYDRMPISNKMAKPYTDNILMAIEDLHKTAFLPSCEENVYPSAQEWFDLFQDMVRECQPSTSIRMDMIIAVGRKNVSTAIERPILRSRASDISKNRSSATQSPVLCSRVSDSSAVHADKESWLQADTA